MTMTPSEIRLRTQSKILVVSYEDGTTFEFPAEFLRVHSPSAEVKGHGPGQETLQVGKEQVSIRGIEPIGQYAIRLIYDDGHDTGLYSWQYLYELGTEMDEKWQRYLDRLHDAGYSRQT